MSALGSGARCGQHSSGDSPHAPATPVAAQPCGPAFPLLALPQPCLLVVFEALKHSLVDAVALSSCCRELWGLGVSARRRDVCCAACGHKVLHPDQAFASDAHRDCHRLELPDGDSYAVEATHLQGGCTLGKAQVGKQGRWSLCWCPEAEGQAGQAPALLSSWLPAGATCWCASPVAHAQAMATLPPSSCPGDRVQLVVPLMQPAPALYQARLLLVLPLQVLFSLRAVLGIRGAGDPGFEVCGTRWHSAGVLRCAMLCCAMQWCRSGNEGARFEAIRHGAACLLLQASRHLLPPRPPSLPPWRR